MRRVGAFRPGLDADVGEFGELPPCFEQGDGHVRRAGIEQRLHRLVGQLGRRPSPDQDRQLRERGAQPLTR